MRTPLIAGNFKMFKTVAETVSYVHDLRGLVKDVLARHGRLDVLVNNAGVGGNGVVEESTPEMFAASFNVNVSGVVRCIQQVLPNMRARGSGTIVNVTSVVGKLAAIALTHGVIIEPGDVFFSTDAPSPHLRMGYTAIAEERIEEGVKVEGAGAAGVAALLSGTAGEIAFPCAVVLSGGNIDEGAHTQVLKDTSE